MTERLRAMWRTIAAFAGWVLMLRVLGASGVEQALGNHTSASHAVCEGLAGAGVLGCALLRGQRMADRRSWRPLLLLAVVRFAGEMLWRPYVDGLLHVRYVRAGLESMVLMAGPLWLALLGALGLVPETTPRRTVGAALAGLAAYCLLLQADDMTPRLWEWPALLLVWVQAMGLVWTWSYARRRLAEQPVLSVAGCGMLVLAAVHCVAALLLPAPDARSFAWGKVWGPVAVAATATGVAGVLWYWLLGHAELAVFSMQTLVLWLSAVLFEFAMFGFLSWRIDVAVLVGLGAMWVAMRARVGDDDPVLLGVSSRT